MPTKIPFAIMTSDDTNAMTIKLLESNSYFGMEPSQVKILKQEKVACLADNDARLALDPNEKYKIHTKPHGHGDVHSLLYSSGLLEQCSSKKGKRYSDSESDVSWDIDQEEVTRVKPPQKWDDLISRVVNSGPGLLLTTYEHLRIIREKLLDIEWGYAVLDEGHRIRNPNAENKLSELWPLFDFVFPGKLGVLLVSETEFSVPITVRGRMKADVNAQLPKKTEQVLFCSLTQEQRATYRAFLAKIQE
ncbi:hypothetical protein ZWY2020_037051 [Hordeum vulgare]|nr:hypothetical protein ZWY2020_037051 [Hordeum vulgare]